MKILILSENDVRELLSMEECIAVMEKTLETTARGDAVNPLRTALRFPVGDGLLGMMPAYLASPKSAGIKIVTVMPGNHGTEFDSHQGTVVLFEVEHGCPLAVIEASSVTAIRTAAVSALATRLLAREDASKLAILGSGVQAASHLEAMRCVRDIESVTVWSRSNANAKRFADNESARYEVPVTPVSSVPDAVAGADIVCTATSAVEPILEGPWIAPGTHINAVGACLRSWRELDADAARRSRVYVDRRESADNEAGDLLIAKEEGVIGADHVVGEIGELLLGTVEGRSSHEDITLFESLGIGVEDLGTAHFLYEKAAKLGAGTPVEFGGPAR